MLPRYLFAILGFVAASTASSKTIRDSHVQLADDIYAIDAAVLPLNADVKAFSSGTLATGLVDGIPILLDVVNIHLVNRKAYVDALASPTQTAYQSKAIVDSVTNSVAIDIPAGVKLLISKKNAFESAGQGQVVLASLKLLKSDHDSLSAVVLSKLTGPPDVIAQGNAGVAVIDNALSEGIAAFS